MTTARPPAGQGKPTEEMKRAMRIALNMPEASIMKLPQAQRDILLGFREAHAKRETALYRAKRANRQVMRPGTRLKIKWLTYLLMGALTIFLCFAAHAGAVCGGAGAPPTPTSIITTTTTRTTTTTDYLN